MSGRKPKVFMWDQEPCDCDKLRARVSDLEAECERIIDEVDRIEKICEKYERRVLKYKHDEHVMREEIERLKGDGDE